MDPTTANTDRERRDRLLDWFAAVRRPLPWRRQRTAYGTWLSEVMLQQTTVAVVEPYWHRFMARFPSVLDLAQADEEEVLALWSGLGYYRRARHLHQAARIVARNGGRFPTSRDEWQALPGIGPYASGAIASLVLGERVPAIDANARRVLTRWRVGDPDELSSLSPRELESWGASLVPAQDPGAWNEAVMELGALVCRARQADCANCCVLDQCRAGLAGVADSVPGRKRRQGTLAVETFLVLVSQSKGAWLVPASGHPDLLASGRTALRDDFSGLHQGLWSLPTSPWYDRQEEFPQLEWNPRGAIFQAWQRPGNSDDLPALTDLIHLGSFEHAITRYRIKVQVFLLSGTGTADRMGGDTGPVHVSFQDLSAGKSPTREKPRQSPALGLTALARKGLDLLPDNFG